VANISDVFNWDWTRVQNRSTEDPCTNHDGDHHLAWFDFDGDMLADYALTESGYANQCGGTNNNRVYLFQQTAGNTFQPATAGSGLDEINDNNWAPGNVIPVDYDLDGDEDLLVGLDSQGIRVYRNDVGNQNNWVTVTLRGGGGGGSGNRAAIGARVELSADGTTQTREVYAGNGHQGPQTPLSLTFGLGSAALVDSIRVRWPDAAHTVTEDLAVAVNQFVAICEAPAPADPAGLVLDEAGADLLLTWDDPSAPATTWNVYRDGNPDTSGWGGPHHDGVTDEDPGTPGIQDTDTGAASTAESYYYLVTAANSCDESPLR
jgi:hypothetical protein